MPRGRLKGVVGRGLRRSCGAVALVVTTAGGGEEPCRQEEREKSSTHMMVLSSTVAQSMVSDLEQEPLLAELTISRLVEAIEARGAVGHVLLDLVEGHEQAGP